MGTSHELTLVPPWLHYFTQAVDFLITILEALSHYKYFDMRVKDEERKREKKKKKKKKRKGKKRGKKVRCV